MALYPSIFPIRRFPIEMKILLALEQKFRRYCRGYAADAKANIPAQLYQIFIRDTVPRLT